MILKGSQRGHGCQLTRHLMNADDNDHVEVHAVVGFLGDSVAEAFDEIEAISKGTRCHQPFFSVSLSPPPEERPSIATFEDAIARLAKANGLLDQPHVVIFHEKDGRRHAHAVFSRIDAQSMTAINLPHFKNRMQNLSRELFFENQWKMPNGLRDRRLKSPTNVTLAEWQAAKRRGKNAIDQKALIQQCWAVSDDMASFETALADHGYLLARGDQRGHVIVCHDGEVFTAARATGLKAKDIRARLGDPSKLRSVSEALEQHQQALRTQFRKMAGEVREGLSQQCQQLEQERKAMIANHRSERAALTQGQASRWKREAQARQQRYRSGLVGIWQRLTGKRQTIAKENAHQALEALERDRRQVDELRTVQLSERFALEQQRSQLRKGAFGLVQEIKMDRDALIKRLSEPQTLPKRRRSKLTKSQDNEISPIPDLGL